MQRDPVKDLVHKYPDLMDIAPAIHAAYGVLRETYRQGGKVLICGNGGSAADAEHIVGELMKGYVLKRPLPASMRNKLAAAFPEDKAYLADHLQGALPAISLVSQTALLSAFANDVDPDMIFAQQVYGYGKPGDTLLGISTSGNAPNVLRAMQVARVLSLSTVGLTGRTGGSMNSLCDVAICVPADTTTAIQERHLPVYHTLCAMLEQEFFGE